MPNITTNHAITYTNFGSSVVLDAYNKLNELVTYVKD